MAKALSCTQAWLNGLKQYSDELHEPVRGLLLDTRYEPLAAPSFLAGKCLVQARGALLDSMEPKQMLMVEIRNTAARMKSMCGLWRCLACCSGKNKVALVK